LHSACQQFQHLKVFKPYVITIGKSNRNPEKRNYWTQPIGRPHSGEFGNYSPEHVLPYHRGLPTGGGAGLPEGVCELPLWEREIKTSFRDRKGKPDKRQREILRKYGMSFEEGGKHGKIYLAEDPDRYIAVSSTPSCGNTGKNIARDIVRRLLNGYN